jgi:hypothetical protein
LPFDGEAPAVLVVVVWRYGDAMVFVVEAEGWCCLWPVSLTTSLNFDGVKLLYH